MMSHTEMSQFSCLTTVCHSDVTLLIEYLLSFLIGITLLIPKAIYRILEGGASSILRGKKTCYFFEKPEKCRQNLTRSDPHNRLTITHCKAYKLKMMTPTFGL